MNFKSLTLTYGNLTVTLASNTDFFFQGISLVLSLTLHLSVTLILNGLVLLSSLHSCRTVFICVYLCLPSLEQNMFLM